MGGRPAVASLNIRGKWAWFYDEGRFLLSVCTVYSLAFRSFGREGGREGVALRLGNVTPESNPTPTGLARFIPSARLACKSSRGAIKPETDRLTTNTTTRVGTQKEKVISPGNCPFLKAAVVLPAGRFY